MAEERRLLPGGLLARYVGGNAPRFLPAARESDADAIEDASLGRLDRSLWDLIEPQAGDKLRHALCWARGHLRLPLNRRSRRVYSQFVRLASRQSTSLTGLI